MRAATSNVPPPSYFRYDASPQLLPSFHWGSATSDDAFGCQKFRPGQKQWRASVEDWRVETIMELRTPLKNFWLRHCCHLALTVMVSVRAHSFPWAAEFWAKPRNLLFAECRGILTFPRNFAEFEKCPVISTIVGVMSDDWLIRHSFQSTYVTHKSWASLHFWEEKTT